MAIQHISSTNALNKADKYLLPRLLCGDIGDNCLSSHSSTYCLSNGSKCLAISMFCGDVGVTPFYLKGNSPQYSGESHLVAFTTLRYELLCIALLVYTLLVACYLLPVTRYSLWVTCYMLLSVISYIYNALRVTRYRYACSVYRNVGFEDQRGGVG